MRTEVNGVLLDPEMIRSHAAMLRQEARDAGYETTPEDGLKILEQATDLTIVKTLLEQEAARLGLAEEQLFDSWCKSLRAPRPRDVRDAYLQNREQFWAPASILVSHIVKNVNHEDERELRHAEIARVLETLMAGADFAETADAHSDCPGNGGRIGYIERGEMVPEFEDVVFMAPLGQITPIFATRFGFHIALVSESRAGGIRPFEEVASHIEKKIWNKKRSGTIADRIQQLRAQAVIRHVSTA